MCLGVSDKPRTLTSLMSPSRLSNPRRFRDINCNPFCVLEQITDQTWAIGTVKMPQASNSMKPPPKLFTSLLPPPNHLATQYHQMNDWNNLWYL